MRKNKRKSKKSGKKNTRYTKTLFAAGMMLILPALLWLAATVGALPRLTPHEARYYALILEHILAALAALTAGCYLLQRAAQSEEKDRR